MNAEAKPFPPRFTNASKQSKPEVRLLRAIGPFKPEIDPKDTGLEKEGIYRVSGKHTDVVELKQLLERDVGQVNLLEERWDLHVIAATVKLYLRTLPIPLFPFPPKE